MAMKKVLPKTESDNVKVQYLYSKACSRVKHVPSPIVHLRPRSVSSQLLLIIDICAQVMVAPLERSSVVFSRGTSNGLMAETPAVGQTEPVSTLGLSAE